MELPQAPAALRPVVQIPRRAFPCDECPVRCDNADNPRSKFPAGRWESLSATVTNPPSITQVASQPLFGCHKGEPGSPDSDLICAGWLAAFGWDSLKVRIAVSVNLQLSPEALRPGDNWPELYATWDAMVAAQMWHPGDPADHLPENLTA